MFHVEHDEAVVDSRTMFHVEHSSGQSERSRHCSTWNILPNQILS